MRNWAALFVRRRELTAGRREVLQPGLRGDFREAIREAGFRLAGWATTFDGEKAIEDK